MGKVNCLELYSSYGLPIEEAYSLAGFKYFYSESADDLSVVEALQNEICRIHNRAPSSFEDAAGFCKRHMAQCGYSDYKYPGVFMPACNIDGNAEKPEDQRVRNTTDYYELYKKGAVCLADAYVLAKNKNFLLCDDDMLPMLFALEDKIMEDCRAKGYLYAGEITEEYQKKKPRKQLTCHTTPINWIIMVYMKEYGYMYEPDAGNSFMPCKKKPAETADKKEDPADSFLKHYETNRAYDKYYGDGRYPREAVLYIHGGAFRHGDKGDNKDFLAALAEMMGMCVYSVGFRNIDEARSLRTMIEDILKCMYKIAKDEGIDRFHLVGASSGAYLAWIVSLMVKNRTMYDVGGSFEIVSNILISGYFIFGLTDAITETLALFPAWQGFPMELKNVEMDYSAYVLPPTLLITGNDDGCLGDSKALCTAVKKTSNSEIVLYVAESSEDPVDHCFILKHPSSNASRKALAIACDFCGKQSSYEVKLSSSVLSLKAVKFYGPVSRGIMLELEEKVSCEPLLDFFRYTDGCTIVNSNGEIHILRAAEFLTNIEGKTPHLGMLPVGSIKDQGKLYIKSDGTVVLIKDEGDNCRPLKQWKSIGSLLQIEFNNLDE